MRVALLCGRCKLGAGAHEVEVHALDEALLLVAQVKRVAPGMHGIQAREQAGVHRDRAGVRGHQRRQRHLYSLQFGRGFGRGEVVEQAFEPRQQPAAAVERRHGVVQARRLGRCGDRVDLRELLFQRRVERGAE
ncbi:MAG TPA: hypothetical protein VKI18_02600, partial [Albitalea sp.]|nr:hypothetical protein [Albitalea sp.]